MKLRRLGLRVVILGAIVSLTAAACGSSSGTGLSGQVVGDGSSTVQPLSAAVAEEFQVIQPGIQVPVGTSGTGGGFKKFCSGETDFSNASRPIKEEEITACRAKGIAYEGFQVAIDGIAVVVNKSNDWIRDPDDCLTTAELAKIWEPAAEKKVTSWSQVRDGFPDVPLKLFGAGTDSGTFDYFTDVINGEEGASRTDYSPTENDNDTVKGVKGTRGGLGYFGFSYYAENRADLKIVAVDGGGGCITPSDDTVKSNEYAPLSRPLLVYVREDAAKRPEVKAFFDFYFGVVNDVAPEARFTPLSDAVLAEQAAKWQAFAG